MRLIDKVQYYEHFYEIFEEAILNLIRPNMFLTLSGGWDTRVIAGILWNNKITMPVVSWGSKLESLIATKVASVLGFQHFFVFPSPKDTITTLYANGYRYMMTANLFDEINGSWGGFKAKTYDNFCEAQEKAINRLLYRLRKWKKCYEFLNIIMPILNKQVLTCLEAIPWRMRTGKQIQRWILKNKFPNLWRIPYYNSLLPNFLPYYIHGIASHFHNRQTMYLKTKSLFGAKK